jgi:hypothetical protein
MCFRICPLLHPKSNTVGNFLLDISYNNKHFDICAMEKREERECVCEEREREK